MAYAKLMVGSHKQIAPMNGAFRANAG